jgi:hypothetical protein
MNQWDDTQNDPYDGGEFAEYGDAQPKSNVLGIVGFILSFCLPPIGLVLSAIALGRQPRGFAVAGTIIGLLLTLLLAGAGGGLWWFMSQPENKAMSQVQEDMGQVFFLNEQYESQNGQPAPTLANLNLPREVVVDPWNNLYVYETREDGSWTITTMGPDGELGTADDLQAESTEEYLDFLLDISMSQITTVWKEPLREAGGLPEENLSAADDLPPPTDADETPPADDGPSGTPEAGN